jgi:hypothetical protein
MSLAGHPDPERFVAEFSGSDRTVAEYLLAEMLERQPDDVQQLLRRTSLLDRVNGELADLLTDRSGSERILLDLPDANAFVVSLDPQRTWSAITRPGNGAPGTEEVLAAPSCRSSVAPSGTDTPTPPRPRHPAAAAN